jgi:hypothetical protein
MFDGADMIDIHKLRAFVAVVEESNIACCCSFEYATTTVDTDYQKLGRRAECSAVKAFAVVR